MNWLEYVKKIKLTFNSAIKVSSFSTLLKLIEQDVLISASLKIVNEYDQEIPQSQTADNPVAP